MPEREVSSLSSPSSSGPQASQKNYDWMSAEATGGSCFMGVTYYIVGYNHQGTT